MTFTQFDKIIDYLKETLGLNENKATEVAQGIFNIVGFGGYTEEEIYADFLENFDKILSKKF